VLQLIKVSYPIGIFITYNLQFYVTASILWSAIFRSSGLLQSLSTDCTNPQKKSLLNSKIKLDLIQGLLRICLVGLTFLLALSIPKIDLFINLVGSVPCTTLSLIIPPLLDLTVFWHTDKSVLRLLKNIFIVVFGIYIFVSGIYVSLKDIVKYYKHF
jgi:proton-coupled amino acid transporter